MVRRKNTFEKKTGLNQVLPGHPGFCSSRSFILPGPVQPLGQLGLGLVRQVSPGLITMLGTPHKLNLIYRVK